MVKETGLQVFENENFGNVRVVMRDGDPWFVAADVCGALEVGNPSQALTRVDDDERFTTLISNEGAATGQSQMAFVNEPGLYSLVLGSRKPEAKAFKRWITHDVIPTIRKTGGYINDISKFVTEYFPQADDSTRMFIAQSLEENKRQQAIIKKQSAQIEEQRPAVEFTETVCKSSDNIKMREMAKLLCDEKINIGEKRLYNLLRQKKVLMQDKAPYQSFVDRGYFYVSESSYTTVYGTTGISSTTLVTPKGQIWLVGKVREWIKAA